MTSEFPFGEPGHQSDPQFPNENKQNKSFCRRALLGVTHFFATGSSVISFAILLM